MNSNGKMFSIEDNDFDSAIDYSLLHNELQHLTKIKKSNQKLQRIQWESLNEKFREREQNRRLRAKLKSSDGSTVEVHDQFYRDHKLLLVLFRVLAVMPILRSSPGRITFSWKSGATIYAIIFWCAMTVVVLIVGRERMQILLTTKQFDEYIYAIIFIIYLIPHFWIPFVGWGVAAEVAKYKTSWGAFQLRFYRVTGTSLQFPRLKILIVIISIGCLLCAVLFLWSLSFLLDGYPLWHTLAYYHIITMVNMNCALWYINSRAFKAASHSLAVCFQNDVKEECTCAIISQYRFLWLNLSELLQSLGNAYARTYSTYCLFIFVNIAIAVYGAFAEIVDHIDGYRISYKTIGLIVDALYCSTLLFIFCDCSHNATLGVARGVQDTLLSIDSKRADKQAQKEIDLFIVAIEMNPAIVSLKGYVNVNRELLTSFYHDHKLLLKLFVFLGVMPVIHSAPGVITFKWNSIEMVYAFGLYILTTSLVITVGYERVKILQTITEFDEYIYAIIFVIFLVPHFWIPFVGWGAARRVAAYKTMWGSFQVKYYRVTGSYLTFPKMNLLIIILFIGCILQSVVFLFSLSRMLDGFLLWHTIAYFHIITMINMNCALFYINSLAIGVASNGLASRLSLDIAVNCSSEIFSKYRLLWLSLCDLLQTLGNAYARTFSTYCLFMAINITISVYGSFMEIFDTGLSWKVLGLIVLTVYCIVLLFIVCNCGHTATKVVAQNVQDTLLGIDLSKIEQETKKEIDYFIATILISPPVVNMQGYGCLDRKLLTSLISTIAVYLLVLLQFKLSIHGISI